DVYVDGSSFTVSVTGTSNDATQKDNFEALDTSDKGTVTVNDTITPIDVTITAIVSTPKIIDITTATDGTTGVKITGINSDGEEVDLSIISGTNHDGFGVDGKNLSNGDTKELGVGEKIVVEFTNGKDVNSLDVSFAWRNNHETAKLTFVKDGQVVGYATVDGDGSSTTKAIVKYYDENNNLIKTQEAEGSSDRVDKAFTFELPDSNGGIVSFDKVEFSAPQNKDDYLINKIVYKEVLNPEVTDIVTNGGDITFNIQVDENYPPQGTATATVEVNGKEYSVELNSTGRGTLTIDSKELGDLSNIIAKVTEVKGGNYEKVNPTEASFNFTPTLKSTDDNISTDEDVSYTIKVTDFGEVSSNTKEFKITELPTPEIGKLFLTIKTGDTIFNSDGTKTVATEDIKVEITKDQIVTLGQVGAGKVEFVPKENSDVDGSFKFQVGDGNGKFSEEYTTTIDVKAVADAPTVSIDITKIGATTIVVDGNGNSTSDTNSSNENGSSSIDMPNNWWNGLTELTKDNVINNNSTHNIESIDWSNRPSFTDGNDIVNIGTLTSSSNGINTGEGDDRIYISENIENNGSNINSGDGNDTVLLAKDVNSNVDLGVGNDRLDIKGNLGSTINAGSGDDKIFIKGSASQNSTINLGEGNNELHVKGDVGIVNGGSVADTVLVEGSTTNTINLGDGNNELHIKQNSGNTVTTGSGNDKIFIEGNSENTVTTGSGNDRVIIAGNTGNVIDLGSGNDYLEIDGKVANSLNGGEGIDSLYLKSYTKADYDNNVDNLKWKIIDFENIKLGDGTIVKGDGSVFETPKPENIIKAVEYKVDISAALTDTDRSETLSVVIKNVPTGAVLESTKYDVSKNSDGSWSVNFKAGTTGDALLKIEDSLTMKVLQSYKGDINLQIEAKATEKNDNLDGNNFATAKDDASVVTVTIESFNAELDMDISESTIKVIETKDVNTLATTSAGIYEKDGKYYKTEVQSHTEKVLDTEALKNLQVTINGKTYTGITVGADGKYYVIDNTIAKEQKTIEVEREVTKTIELDDKSIDAFMIQVTKETKGIVLGKEVTNLGAGDTISNTKSKIYTLEQPTSNIEIKFTSGSAKLEFVDANGKVIGSSTTQTGTDSKGYSVPKDAVGVKITSTSTSLKIDAIKYHVDPHEETVQVGGKILDVESMQKAGITWNSTISEKQVQTITNEDLKKNIDYDLVKLGSEVGDGNIKGFNPEAKANSQVFDFGKDKAYQLVTIKVDATISGSWNFNKDSTKDVFVVNANGVPQGAYNYTSSQDYNNITPSQTRLNTDIATAKTNGYDLSYVNGTLNKTYEYKVYLDENGQVQMNFVVASTNTDEFVTVNNISVSYAGLSGFVQTKTEIEKVTETIFVGVPTNVEYKGELPTKEITKYETVQVETTPIYTKLTQYEYKLDLSAAISEGKGELSEFTLKHIPNGVSIKGYESNEDGSYTIKIGEDGKAQVTLISDSLLSSDEKEGITANISASSEDDNQTSDIEVNIDGEISHSSNVTGTEDNNDISINTDNLTSINIDGGDGYDTIKLEENSNIDFSKLENLSIKNIEAIDLTEGNHKLQNLTLDDVLKISGEDNTIKISGDEFDSVTFKNTVGDDGKENAWSKTEGTGADKGYDIYMNSGDPTVQVKVEQPISDGITN
uniref:hypothetical protein n=1 Tax=Aliarcobacter butzleri TaxID=28197 RepID=UPI0018E04522